MLLNLLPALRDFRTPLAAGYLWLCSIWLVFRRSVPPESEATGVVAATYDLIDWLGPAPTLAVISFVAYIIGTVATLQFVFPAIQAARPPSFNYSAGGGMNDAPVNRKTAVRFGVTRRTSKRIQNKIRSQIQQYVDTQSKDRPHWDKYLVNLSTRTMPSEVVDKFVEELTQRMKFEFDDLERRLRFHDRPELYQDYDRMKSEAEFRLGVSIPMAVLIIVVAAYHSAWFFFLLAIPAFLALQGSIRRRDARSDLYEAMSQGVIGSSLLEGAGDYVRFELEHHAGTYDEFVKYNKLTK